MEGVACLTTSLVSEHFSPRLGAPDRIVVPREILAILARRMGSSFRGRRMPVGLASETAKIRGAAGRGLSGRGLRQQAVLAVDVGLELSGSPSGKPNATSPSRITLFRTPENSCIFLRFLRFFARILQNFCNLQQLVVSHAMRS